MRVWSESFLFCPPSLASSLLSNLRRSVSNLLNFTSGPSTPPQLPDDLIAEILEDSCLSTRDLYQLCLVSRKFRRFSQRALFEKIPVTTWWCSGGGGGMFEEWSISSWHLLCALEQNEGLRDLVQEVEYNTSLDYPEAGRGLYKSDGKSGERSSQHFALMDFLDLLPNVKRVNVKHHRSKMVVTQYPRLEQLTLSSPERLLENVPSDLPNLKGLRVRLLHDMPPLQPGQLTTLKKLDVHGRIAEPENLALLSLLSPALRILRISLAPLPSVDFAQLPLLDTLHMYNDPWGWAKSESFDTATAFFGHLAKDPSLTTLSLEGRVKLSDASDQDVRPSDTIIGGGGRSGCAVINSVVLASLETLRFELWFQLPAILSFLNSPACRQARKLVVPAIAANPFYKTKLEVVREQCSSKGIELFYAAGFLIDEDYISEEEYHDQTPQHGSPFTTFDRLPWL
ncbi:hypothetical protein JCM3765_007602 [Sporobolomyces pararoseus]